MRLPAPVALLACALACGCLMDAGPKDTIDLNTSALEQAHPATTTLPPTTTTLKPTTTSQPPTTTSESTTTSTTVPQRPWPTMTVTTSTSTTSTSTSTTTTIRCTQECTGIKMPTPRNCATGCCISSDTHCVYKTSFNGGPSCRCM